MIRSKQKRFETLVESYSTDLFRYALWLAHDRQVAEDLVQETFTRAWKSFHQLKEKKAEKGWLTTILRNENARRFQRIQPDLVEIDNVPLSADHKDEPEARIEQRILRKAMLELEEKYREPLVLQIVHGFSCREIAQTMEISENAVMTRIFRAKQQLKSALTETNTSVVVRL
ncbi:MAG: sigma-70 family RNA polymerase sigma factor [Pseudomonadota bacterium]